MLHDSDSMLCEKCYHLTGSMWMCIIMVEDEFLLQFWSFFSVVCEQSIQNLKIILRIDNSFLSFTTMNDSTFVKNKMIHITWPTDLARGIFIRSGDCEVLQAAHCYFVLEL